MVSVMAIGLCATVAAPARANIITFNGQPTGTITSFTEDGFTIESTPGNPGDTSTLQNVGGTNQNVLVDGNPNDPFGTVTRITRTDGGHFSLVSLDVGNLDNPGSPLDVAPGSGLRIEINGVPSGGPAVFGPGSSTFTTVHPIDFTNLTELDINIVSVSDFAETFAVDNIVLAPVPEPTSIALLCTGLAGLLLVRRRK